MKRLTQKLVLSAVLGLACMGLSYVPAAAAFPVYVAPLVRVAPPPPRHEFVPPPRPGFVWAPGYWHWDGYRYVWLPGYWARVRPGYVYRPAYWEPYHHHYRFHPGYWGR